MSKKKKQAKAKDRFKIVQANTGCFLVDTDNEPASIPLAFAYHNLNDNDKMKLYGWLDYLNKGG